MAKPKGILETVLFVDELERARSFYERVLGLQPFIADERGCGFRVAEAQLLLLVSRAATGEPNETPGGTVPACGADGPQHVAFAVPAGEVDAWRDRLEAHGVPIASEVRWQRGGRSLYFRDPDGHLLELATPGVWDVY